MAISILESLQELLLKVQLNDQNNETLLKSCKGGTDSGHLCDICSTNILEKYYVMRKKIGHGTYGVVRRCIHRQTRQIFAVKTIEKEKVRKIDRTRREVSILQCLSHPNIMELKEAFEDEKYIHLVTPLYTGGELYDRIAQRRRSRKVFSEQEAGKLVKDMLDAISYCHSQGIVHRDVKPENFIFESKYPDAKLKLIDFGLSAFHNPSNSCPEMKSRVGTVFYIAPEVLQRKYAEKCDIWSIGVILYLLLFGNVPFDGTSDSKIFSKITHEDFRLPDDKCVQISPEAKDFLYSLLQKNQSDRPSAAEALNHPWICQFVD